MLFDQFAGIIGDAFVEAFIFKEQVDAGNHYISTVGYNAVDSCLRGDSLHAERCRDDWEGAGHGFKHLATQSRADSDGAHEYVGVSEVVADVFDESGEDYVVILFGE